MAQKQLVMTPERSAQLLAWKDAKDALKLAQDNEQVLRNAIVMELGTPSKLEGRETYEIGAGWKLCIEKKQNYSLTNKDGETIGLLNIIGQQDPQLAQSLVDWKPELRKKAYNLLLKTIEEKAASDPEFAAAVKDTLSAALTIKPGMPSIELIPPELTSEQATTNSASDSAV
jgi:hypothetical protein